MKKLLSFITVFGISAGMYAQYMVSTSPSNRNVLLEDLTGQYCGYCPDGARIADGIKAVNPGRVVIIGNHAGSYAVKGSTPGSLLMSTLVGEEVNSYSSPSGYPAGNINRRVTTYAMKAGKTAMSRGAWETAAGETMATPSQVNIEVDAFYRPGTNVIEIRVEGYYTADGNGSDYLHVAILQDNIESYQSGASGYPARVNMSNGLYRQMDVLRGYIAGNIKGEEISTTTKETFFSRSYQYTASQLNDVIPVITDMKVAVFMTEESAWSEVITADVSETVEARSVGINEATSLNDLNIYPNPFVSNAVIEFNLDDAQYLSVKMFDVTGKVVLNNSNVFYGAGNHKINVDGASLENGLYYVNIIAEDGIITRKLVLNK